MPKPSVLVVDDDVGAVETLADILEANAYRVTTAYSGEAAVEMTRATRYDAVLMDIRMPGLNGVEALRAIKAWVPSARVIMMTAFSLHELIEEALRESAIAVLPKPLEMDRVLDLLEQTTRTRRDGREGLS